MAYLLSKKNLHNLVDSWSETYDVFVPQRREKFSQFLPYSPASEFVFENPHNTSFPPKAFFLPQSEVLFKFSRSGAVEPQNPEQKSRILFGVRPCDGRAINLLDTNFETVEYIDPYWKNRRDHTLVIGLGCSNPSASCFCTTVGSTPFGKQGLDALLTERGEDYVIEVISEGAQELFGSLPEVSAEVLAQTQSFQEVISASMSVVFETEGLKETLDKNFENPYWEQVSKSCLGCGVCTFLCPTCFCFDIADEARRSERIRNWDTCMFRTYSLEASGHNPRPTRKERTRQRLMHKFSYWIDHIGEIGCTGCGRCVRYCPVGLDIRAMLRKASALETEVANVG